MFYTFFNAPCQYTPLLNLRPLAFGLTTFGWLRSVTLNPFYSVISCGNTVSDLRILYLTQLFSNTAKALNIAWCSMKVVIHPGLTVNFPDCETGKRNSTFWVGLILGAKRLFVHVNPYENVLYSRGTASVQA